MCRWLFTLRTPLTDVVDNFAQVESQISKGHPGPSARRIKDLADELHSWKEEATKLRNLLPVVEAIQKLRTKTLPELQEQLKASKDKLAAAQENVEKVIF